MKKEDLPEFDAHLFDVVRAENYHTASWTQPIHVASDRF